MQPFPLLWKGFPLLVQPFPLFKIAASKKGNFALCISYNKLMARFSKEKTEEKKLNGKDLYVKGFDLETISQITEVALSTVKRWYKDYEWDAAKQSRFISIAELRNTILQSFIDLKDGKKPNIKPDEAAKYASAFEKLSDKKKVLSYMYESFDMLTDELAKDVQNAKSKKDKEQALLLLKRTREKTDTILTKLTAEALNEN